MGLFDDFDIDMDEVEESSFASIKDGFYEFETTELMHQNGSKNKPDYTYKVLKFDLDEAGTYWEWFVVAVHGETDHKDAKRGLGNLKTRLLSLGFLASELNEIEPEDVEGITGSLQLVTTQGKGANAGNYYQNVRNVKVEDPDAADEPAPAPEPEPDPKAADAAAKRRVAARQAARTAPAEEAAAPAARPSRRRAAAPAADEDAANPFE